jgi:glycyl-tRNA synthetase beta chain
MPESLLDEVAALVEWPVVYECKFEEEFLAVPQECLILTMQTNQKYFALTDSNGKLRSRFLIVSNIATDTPAAIIGGNERVVRPRLSDAKFFFEQDKKKTLESRLPLLANVVYHNKLGTQAERSERVAKLAGKIAANGRRRGTGRTRSLLAKADLLTDMVGEFPELQGIMGTYYARNDGEHEDVALAASEHYQPRFAGDALPSTVTGTAVALADKLETLVGIWAIGLHRPATKTRSRCAAMPGRAAHADRKRLPLSICRCWHTPLRCSAMWPASKTRRPKSPFCWTACAASCANAASRQRDRSRGGTESDRLDDIVQRLEAVQASPPCRNRPRWPLPTSASPTS